LPREVPVKIEVLYFEGCPIFRPAVERLKAVLRREGVTAEIAEIEIEDEAAAKKFEFPGSPTIRINGLDIDVGARGANAGTFACRRYEGGLPSEMMMRRALREAQGRANNG
jgi:Domain of unknown function (DUF2703)